MIKKLFIFCLIIFLASTSKQNAFAQTKAVNNPESLHELTLEVDKNEAVANGQDTVTITATLKDRTTFEPLENPTQGTPIANVRLTFEVSGEGVNLNQPSQATDANGQIKAYLTATIAGEKTITVMDSSLNSITYPADYRQVSLNVTFSTPSTLIPTITPTPIPELNSESSYFTIDPLSIHKDQTATIKITLLDKNSNSVTDKVPYITVSGEGNTVIQPTIEVNSLAYFSSTVIGQKKITVKVKDMQIGEESFVNVSVKPHGWLNSNLDISLGNPPKNKLQFDGHKNTPIYFHIPKDRYVEKVNAVMHCEDGQQLEIALSLHSENGGQIFGGYVPKDQFREWRTKCILRITVDPQENPDEPEEPIEIPIEPIDPFGTIYDAKTGKIVIGAVVTLYELQNNNWIIWNGAALQQINPQTTDESGLYSFFVYPGEYSLTVEKEGFQSFQSEVIEVIEEPVKLDVYLNPSPNITLFLWLIALLVPVGFVVVGFFVWTKKRKTPVEPENKTGGINEES